MPSDSFVAERIPSSSFERRGGAVAIDKQDFPGRRDLTDTGEFRKVGRTLKPLRPPRRNGKKEAIIVAAVKRHWEGIQFQLPGCVEKSYRDRDVRQEVGVEPGADPAGAAEAAKICREAVGNVHHCGGYSVVSEPFAQLHVNPRV